MGQFTVRSLPLSHDPLQLRFRPVNAQSQWALTWWYLAESDFAYVAMPVLPQPREEERILGRDESGALRKQLVPPTLGIYAPTAEGKIVGVSEAVAPGNVDVMLVASSQADNNPLAPTVVNLCAFEAKF